MGSAQETSAVLQDPGCRHLGEQMFKNDRTWSFLMRQVVGSALDPSRGCCSLFDITASFVGLGPDIWDSKL